MNDLNVRRQIDNPNRSAEDWELFASSAKNKARVDRAAFRLNEKFTECVNAGMERDTVETAVHDVMVQFSDTGAFDTEPRGILQDMLDEVFGPK